MMSFSLWFWLILILPHKTSLCFLFLCFLFLRFQSSVLELEPRALCMLAKLLTTDLGLPPLRYFVCLFGLCVLVSYMYVHLDMQVHSRGQRRTLSRLLLPLSTLVPGDRVSH